MIGVLGVCCRQIDCSGVGTPGWFRRKGGRGWEGLKYTLTLYTRATSSHVQRLALLLDLVREPITRSDTPPMLCRSDRKLSRGVGVGLHLESIGQARVSDADAGDRPQQHTQPRRDRQTKGERDRWTVTAGPSGAGFKTALQCRRALSTSSS